jgi:hypothetical protein
MRTALDQRIARTHLDRVGERLTKSFLGDYASDMQGGRLPLTPGR